MPEYINPNGYAVHLQGPNGRIIVVKSRQKVTLPDYFDKYCISGFIKKISGGINYDVKPPIPANAPKKNPSGNVGSRPLRKYKAVSQGKEKEEQVARTIKRSKILQKFSENAAQQQANRDKKIVISGKHLGRVTREDATNLLKTNLAANGYPISNGIGIGILSYNRKGSLERLIDSILNYTDLSRTTVFISDDNSSDESTKSYIQYLSTHANLVVLNNDVRLGIAGNSNRLLRCLSRFKYGILLNDDVEVLSEGWEKQFIYALEATGLHHIMHRQLGVYGAQPGKKVTINGVNLNVIDEKPHGAALVFTAEYLDKCGYFNESYGLYGMEHIDWSLRGHEMGLQRSGFFDLASSTSFMKLHSDPSSIENKSQNLSKAREVFSARKVGYVSPSAASSVPSIAYVVPFRDVGRGSSIETVINNIKAQRYPHIEIIMVEQDDKTKVNVDKYRPVNYYLASVTKNELFNKSMAFNVGVDKTSCDKLVLHDADMLVQGHYTKAVSDILNQHGGCHIGNRVIYADEKSTDRINELGVVDSSITCERVVGYFEGGSLACTTKAYWHCGGFNEDFWGYGVEDCEFFSRLSHDSIWYENRTFDFLHLFHGRVDGWNNHHEQNKKLGAILRRQTMQERINGQYSQLLKKGYRKYAER